MVNNLNSIFIGNSMGSIPIKVCDTKHGCVRVDNNKSSLLVSFKERSVDIVFIGSLLYATEYNDRLYILTQIDGKLYVLGLSSDINAPIDEYSLSISDYDYMFSSVSNGIALVAGTRGDILIFSPENSTKKSDGIYEGSFTNIIRIPTNNKLSEKAFVFRGNTYIPVEGTRDMLRITDETYDLVNFDMESDFSEVSLIVRCGTSLTPSEDYGISTIIVNKTNIVIVDMEDRTGYTIYSSSVLSASRTEEDIFIYSSDGLILLDTFSLELYKPTCNIKGNYTIASDESMFLYNSTNAYRLTKSDNVCVITIYCANQDGDYIHMEDGAYMKSATVTIAPPLLAGWESINEPVEVNTDSDFAVVTFIYKVQSTTSTINVTVKSYDEIIDTYTVFSVLGEEYKVEVKNIEGYSFLYSEKASGVCDREVIECVMYYAPVNSELDYDAFVNLKVNSFTQTGTLKHSIDKLIPVSGIKNITIKAPDVNFHKTLEPTILIGNINYGIVDDSCDYEEVGVTKKAIVFYKGIELFSDYVGVKDGKVYHSFPQGIECSIKDTTEDTLYVIADSMDEESCVVRFIDAIKGKVLYTYFGKEVKIKELTINGYSLSSLSSYIKDGLLITDMNYRKTHGEITVKHMLGDELLREDNLVGEIGDIAHIDWIEDTNLSLSVSEEMINRKVFFTYDSQEIIAIYERKSVSIIYKFISVSGELLDTIGYTVEYGSTGTLRDASGHYDTIVSNPVDSDTDMIFTQDLTYDIYVLKNDFNFIYEKKANTIGKVRFSLRQNQYQGDSLIAVCDEINVASLLYIVKGTAGERTKSLLTQNNIYFVETEDLNIAGGVYLNGDFYDHNAWKDDVSIGGSLLITVKCEFDNFIETIKLAVSAITSDSFIKVTPEVIESELSITDIKGNKYRDEVTISINMNKKANRGKYYNFRLIDPITLNEVYAESNFISYDDPFSSYEYSITDTESIILDRTTRKNIDIKNSDNILSFVLNARGLDDVGNTSNIDSKYFEIYTKSIAKVNTDEEILFNHNLSRVNNRYEGVRESQKHIAIYDGIKKACSDIKDILGRNNNEV